MPRDLMKRMQEDLATQGIDLASVIWAGPEEFPTSAEYNVEVAVEEPLVMDPGDEEMVQGIIDMLRMVKDTTNRMEIANSRLQDFASQGIWVSAQKFMDKVMGAEDDMSQMMPPAPAMPMEWMMPTEQPMMPMGGMLTDMLPQVMPAVQSASPDDVLTFIRAVLDASITNSDQAMLDETMAQAAIDGSTIPEGLV
jgi:hypothetical protein